MYVLEYVLYGELNKSTSTRYNLPTTLTYGRHPIPSYRNRVSEFVLLRIFLSSKPLVGSLSSSSLLRNYWIRKHGGKFPPPLFPSPVRSRR
jgi:hypothetical protein